MSDIGAPKSVFIIAGEASGDVLGGALLTDLLKTYPNIKIYGIGGDLIQEKGTFKSLFPMSDLSVMGISEILPKISMLLNRIKVTVEEIERVQPNIILTIDAPDFCFRVVKRVRKRGVCPNTKFVHYVAPTVWAWRAGRAKKVATLYDKILCLLPFEPPYFTKHGMQACFVGHPVMNSPLLQGNKDVFSKDSTESLGVFLGSRRGELKRTGAIIAETALKWLNAHPNRQLIIPTLDYIYDDVQALFPKQANIIIITDQMQGKADAFAAMDLAIAVSGTIGLELSACGIPHLVAYKASPLTALIVGMLIKTKYAHLTNIMMDQAIIPEYIQGNCTVDKLYEGLDTLNVEAQRAAFKTVSAQLSPPDDIARHLLT